MNCLNFLSPGQQPVFLLTGEYADKSHVLSRTWGDPSTTWYKAVRENKHSEATHVSFEEGKLEMQTIATDFQEQRAYIFDPIHPSITHLDVPLESAGTLFQRLPIPVSRKVSNG